MDSALPGVSASTGARAAVCTVLALLWAMSAVPHSSATTWEPTGLCDPVNNFIESVTDTADGDAERAIRQQAYTVALRTLLHKARRHFGPFWDHRPLKQDALAYIRHHERYREPPTGWEPGPSVENLLEFTRIGELGRKVYNNLTRWCWRPVP
jgi:hypothetical protein